jgi:leucyl-tRNA synthetase
MLLYDFKTIEQKWQTYWDNYQTFLTLEDTTLPKYYVLTMFPYPSGEGLHVGHPLGYIAADIVARYKRSQGYNVLYPMGFDAFGLPAEQYAIQTGQHPAITTAQNIARYKQQLQRLGLAYDWRREVITCDPTYYKWTQWLFKCLFDSWYDNSQQSARPIQTLVNIFSTNGNQYLQAACSAHTPLFSAQDWQKMSESEQQKVLLQYRLAFLEETTVNWCPELGTVLANDEVKNGVSERGGYPVVPKKMQQWVLRITAYAERLLQELDHLAWPLPVKEMQSQWIGKSVGTLINFELITQDQRQTISVFTTRPETIFGVTYLALAPEYPLIPTLTTTEYQEAVKAYIKQATNRSERDRLSEVKHISGQFTGAYAIHPFTKQPIPIWIADYIIGSYGTGAIMGVPAHNTQDYYFAQHFHLPSIQVIDGLDMPQQPYTARTGAFINSDFLNGLSIEQGLQAISAKLDALGIGQPKTIYRLRDAIFSRQRYWGEPFPIYYKDGMPYALPAESLPLELPEIQDYQPTLTGQPPLAHATNWQTQAGYPLELHTMPAWAGSSWYFFRYMDPTNTKKFVDAAKQAYWQAVDLYIGGAEHTTGHLLYARFWTHVMYDLGYVNVKEPFPKLLTQGMIQGRSSFVYRIQGTNQFVSYNLRHQYDTVPMRVSIALVQDDILDIAAFKQWRPELATATFILEEEKYVCGHEMEKMSKSKYNVVNPDHIIEQYGADTLRLYTMFLGPIAQAKPWDTHGIEGVFRFLVKVWRLFHPTNGLIKNQPPTQNELKIIHKTIKKVQEDIERAAFNTAISNLMICVNTLTNLQCANKTILQNLALLLAPFAPHLAEELWQILGYTTSISLAPCPTYQEQYLQEDSYAYPVAINGKLRTQISFPLEETIENIERQVLAHDSIQKWIQHQTPKKVIIVPHKMINIVL